MKHVECRVLSPDSNKGTENISNERGSWNQTVTLTFPMSCGFCCPLPLGYVPRSVWRHWLHEANEYIITVKIKLFFFFFFAVELL